MKLLPALKSLGDLADCEPIILIDSREQEALMFRNLPSRRTEPEHGLYSGDYSFAGGEEMFAVERKSIPDLVSCCTGDNRLRFENELHRLRGFWFARLLIIGRRETIERHEYRSQTLPQSVLASTDTWDVRFIPVVWIPTPEEAALLVERWVWRASREIVEIANNLKRGLAKGGCDDF